VLNRVNTEAALFSHCEIQHQIDPDKIPYRRVWTDSDRHTDFHFMKNTFGTLTSPLTALVIREAHPRERSALTACEDASS
jgi:hypothetical protein